ncbi:MAG: hypothetical protein BroJett007_33840 [Chloroflexota bacterium]|nr:MAG: hypothetical protein BroJett007_33840 [Chloroflexota bacterium]
MPNYCPCKRCRPRGMSFEEAMSQAVKYGRIKNLSEERIAEIEAAKKARLESLKKYRKSS